MQSQCSRGKDQDMSRNNDLCKSSGRERKCPETKLFGMKKVFEIYYIAKFGTLVLRSYQKIENCVGAGASTPSCLAKDELKTSNRGYECCQIQRLPRIRVICHKGFAWSRCCLRQGSLTLRWNDVGNAQGNADLIHGTKCRRKNETSRPNCKRSWVYQPHNGIRRAIQTRGVLNLLWNGTELVYYCKTDRAMQTILVDNILTITGVL